MSTKFGKYWYNEGLEFRAAFLYNLRDGDVQRGGSISKGTITVGQVGFVAAEADVFGWTVKTCDFKASRRCEWQGFELPCMAHPSIPPGKVATARLRRFNYAVAEAISDDVAARAAKLGLPVLTTPSAYRVINVELSRFERQGAQRRATLLG